MISGDRYIDREVDHRIGMASKIIGAFGSTVLGRKRVCQDSQK